MLEPYRFLWFFRLLVLMLMVVIVVVVVLRGLGLLFVLKKI